MITKSLKITALFTFLLTLTACDDDDETSGTGYMQLYNASTNAPKIYLTVNKNDDDDYVASTSTGIAYSKSTSILSYDTDNYDITLSWQDNDDADDLEEVYESTLKVANDSIQFIVIAEDITSPNVLSFDIPLIDDEDDFEDERFNLRLLNMHPWSEGIDIYLSDSNETFNEAVLLTQQNYTQLSDNQKLEQDDYVIYITSAGSSEVLYQSNEITYQSVSQSILVIRENNGAGSSPFTIDKISTNTSAKEYADKFSEAKFRVYNGIVKHDKLAAYEEAFDLHINGIDDSPEAASLPLGAFSDSFLTEFGDYAVSLTMPDSNESIIENHLLSLDVNSDKSIFFYLLEEEVDEDGDGDFDEDGDGYVDEWEITVNSLVVENSRSGSIYNHQINVINLIDDFDYLYVYFVRSDETIETADYYAKAFYHNPKSVTLRNNTYRVQLVGKQDSSDLILGTFDLILNEESGDQFLILEEDQGSPSGYKMQLSNQQD